MGKLPEWARKIRAARYLGVDPEWIETHDSAWYHRALVLESAEIEAENFLAKRNQRNPGKGGS